MRRIGRREWLTLVVFLIVPGLGFSQSGQQAGTLVVTVPGTAPAAVTQPANRAFSREFLNAGIESVSDTREWRSALLVAVEHGYKVSDAGVDGFRAQAVKNYQLASVAATTDSAMLLRC
jgi:hypothetical protein